MELNVKKLKCGGCGGENHHLYIRPNGEVISECVGCKSQSQITTKPKIEINNLNGSGTLCVFE